MNETEQRIYDWLIVQAMQLAGAEGPTEAVIHANDRSACAILGAAEMIREGVHRL